VSGALCGATIGVARNAMVPMAVLGAAGAVAGTLGGAAVRSKLAALFHRDLPAALVEDFIAIVMSLMFVQALR
jgi:uncharacterized membrane protein